MVDFIFVIIEFFRYLLRLRRYEWKSVEVGVSRSLNADFRGTGASPINRCWCQKTRVIAVSCGIEISAVHHLVLFDASTQTDRRTDRRTDRQNFDNNTVHCVICSRTVKMILPRSTLPKCHCAAK